MVTELCSAFSAIPSEATDLDFDSIVDVVLNGIEDVPVSIIIVPMSNFLKGPLSLFIFHKLSNQGLPLIVEVDTKVLVLSLEENLS